MAKSSAREDDEMKSESFRVQKDKKKQRNLSNYSISLVFEILISPTPERAHLLRDFHKLANIFLHDFLVCAAAAAVCQPFLPTSQIFRSFFNIFSPSVCFSPFFSPLDCFFLSHCADLLRCHPQEGETFNHEESSIQALVLTLRGEKSAHISPHTSPRSSRKQPVQNAISPCEKDTNMSSKCSASNGKSNFKPPQLAHNSSSSSTSAASSTSSSNSSISKAPLIELSSNESSRASMLTHQQSSKDEEAPPIPPRNKPPSNSNSNASLVDSTTYNRAKPQIATPTQEIVQQQQHQRPDETKPEIKPKKCFSPPIAAQEESDSDEEGVICGSPETISGE